MSSLSTIKQIESLLSVTVWMIQALDAYEEGTASGKAVSKSARKVIKLLKKYNPADNEKDHYENVLDLCISLSTIERAQGPFKPYYLESLREELTNTHSILGGN